MQYLINLSLNNFKIIAFTHKNTDLKDLGKFHIDQADWSGRLEHLKQALDLKELMYLSTCNRVEFLFWNQTEICQAFLKSFFKNFNLNWEDEELDWAVKHAMVFEGEQALEHFLNVASSIDSLVVGEREIITQVRNSFDISRELGLSGDFIRLLIRKTIETAKQVYTQTAIASKPVSVVSLAYRKLKELNVKLDAKFLIVGAGQANSAMAKYLKKHKFKNFTVFNRTLSNAEKLADELKGEAYPLSSLSEFKKGFDVLITCTGAAELIITKEIYKTLVGDDSGKKIVVDLAIPNDFDTSITNEYPLHLIEVESLKAIAEENLQKRHKELDACRNIIAENIVEFRQMLKTRQVERAMSEVPKKVREIKEMALSTVFAKEIGSLDSQSKEVLDKVLAYMEKKYISMPMKMAKEIFLDDKKY